MSSKFSGIFKARENEGNPEAEEALPPSPAPPAPTPKTLPAKTTQENAAIKKAVGRPPGKRSDGVHVQVTAYIRGETHRAVKIALLQAGSGQEFSELVEELLTKWVKSRT